MTGTECDVEIERPCPKDKKYIGKFHTHPNERVPKFSPRDLNPMSDGIECLGSSRSGKLTCLVLREDVEDLERRINEIGIYASQQIVLKP